MQIRYIIQRARHVSSPRSSGLLQRPHQEEESVFAEGVGRVLCGVLIVFLGILLLSLSTAVLVTDTADINDVDNKLAPAGWGILSGVVTVISGVCAVASRKLKFMVFVFLGISLMSACLCIGGCIWSTFASYEIYLFLKQHNNSKAYALMYLYTVMSISFAIQAMVSLIGASFTWTALRRNESLRQQTPVEIVCAHDAEVINTSNLD